MTKPVRFAHRMNINGRSFDLNEIVTLTDTLAAQVVYAGFASYVDVTDPAPPDVFDPAVLDQYVTTAALESLRDQVNRIPVGSAVRVMPYGTTAADVAGLGLTDAVIVVPDYPPTTNLIPNPSFETDLNGWSVGTGTGSVTRTNDPLDAQDGVWAVTFAATAATTFRYNTVTFPASPGEVFSAGCYFRRKAGTSTVLLCRVEIQFNDAGGVQLSNQFNSVPAVYAADTRQQVLATNKVAPAGTVSVRFRPSIAGMVAGDTVAVDACQLERGVTTLPPYNPVTH